jgi:2-amino-4-hydroxy-6-hydroxymethyldihydropteridine diphosphokinase
MHVTYLLLGSNVGDRKHVIAAARTEIQRNIGDVAATSALYETAPWGMTDQPAFLNQAVKVITELEPHEVLQEIRKIEDDAGRQRHIRWGPRTLDIDILLYDDIGLDTEELTIPHPRLPLRRFALVPLAEIAGQLVHPSERRTIDELLASCPDQTEVSILPDG